MAAITTIELVSALKDKVGEQQAKMLTEYVEQKITSTFQEAKEHLSTKKDLAETKADIIKWMFIFWIGQVATTLAIIYFRK
jgi:hypothetical protein